MVAVTLFGAERHEDNVTDWALEQFQAHYGDESLTKDDVWEYMYGVMHAPDWRNRYAPDLKRLLPRIPYAPNFEAFRAGGRALMDLHLGYESCPELTAVKCLVDNQESFGNAEPAAYRIKGRMRWASKSDRSTLHVNNRCRLEGIPQEAHQYQVSGRSPLEWAVDTLQRKVSKQSGIVNDPNAWHVWSDDGSAFELVRHLRRLAYVGVMSTEIISALPLAVGRQDLPDEA